jgi:pimeloyl-ACP methyl ester carboxylesterase
MIFETMGNPASAKIGLLLHAMAADGSQFREIGALLEDEYFLIIPTFDGHYKEGKTEFTTLDIQVDSILGELQRCGVTELDFIAGTSLGALAAFEIYKRKTLKVRKYVFDGAPFFLLNPVRRKLLFWRFWVSLSLLKRVPRIAKASEKLYGVALTDIFAKNMTFITKRDIYNVISAICRAKIPEPLSDGHTSLVFLYGGREDALRSFKRFRGLPGVELIVKAGYGHCRYAMEQSSEYAEMLRS